MPKLTFSGHESFTCRQFWLKKGYDFLHGGHSFTDPDAVVFLGVGKNMVTSIHYWMKSFDLIDEGGALTELASYLLKEGGADPYLEKPGTLWLLHYLLVSRARASLFAIVFNEFRPKYPIFTKSQLVQYVIDTCEDQAVPVSSTSIQRDVDVLVRSYVRPQRKTASIEDDFITLLPDLNLLNALPITRDDAGIRYAIERRPRSDLPMWIVLYAILEKYQGSSVSFRELANDPNGPGMVFALDETALFNQINMMTEHYPNIVFSDDAGVRELQFHVRPEKQQVLNDYYDRA